MKKFENCTTTKDYKFINLKQFLVRLPNITTKDLLTNTKVIKQLFTINDNGLNFGNIERERIRNFNPVKHCPKSFKMINGELFISIESALLIVTTCCSTFNTLVVIQFLSKIIRLSEQFATRRRIIKSTFVYLVLILM